MITSIEAFLAYFDGVHRRTIRDVAAIPESAYGWRPAEGDDESDWSVGMLIGHLAATRGFFTGAFLGEGWHAPQVTVPATTVEARALLDDSLASLRERLTSAPEGQLSARVRLMESEQTASGWRLLMMLNEHEVHHRSQLNAYATIAGWEPPQVFGQTWESIEALDAPGNS